MSFLFRIDKWCCLNLIFSVDNCSLFLLFGKNHVEKAFKKHLLEFSKKSGESSCFYEKIGYNGENTIFKEITYEI